MIYATKLRTLNLGKISHLSSLSIEGNIAYIKAGP